METGAVHTDESIEKSAVSSLKRTKKKIYEYAFANDWSGGCFFIITFDSEQVDSFNYEECYNRVYPFLKNVKDQNPDFKYLFVPELHKSKRWHFHGIGVNCDKLKFGDKNPDGNDSMILEGFMMEDIDAVTLKIIKTADGFEFTNPGILKLPIDEIFKGGNSKPRNPQVMERNSSVYRLK